MLISASSKSITSSVVLTSVVTSVSRYGWYGLVVSVVVSTIVVTSGSLVSYSINSGCPILMSLSLGHDSRKGNNTYVSVYPLDYSSDVTSYSVLVRELGTDERWRYWSRTEEVWCPRYEYFVEVAESI